MPPLPVYLLLLGLLPAWAAIASRRRQRRLQQAAQARGWRYQSAGLAGWWRHRETIAGTAPQGVVWELRRVRAGGQIYWHWSAPTPGRPYGSLRLLPAGGALAAAPPLRAASLPQLPPAYRLFLTHEQLARPLAAPSVVAALQAWPPPFQPGALHRLAWQEGRLAISALYQRGWETPERLVALALALLAAA